jgi:DNA-directed RNA polymerase II subunit RPB1
MNSNVLNKSRKQKNIQETLDQSDEIYLLRNFQDNLLNNIVLRGLPGITNVLPRKLQNMVVKEDDRYVQKDVYVLDTTGSNLMDVLAFDFIDNKRTYSNDIKEVFNVLGIEAARQILYNEFVEVMEFSDVYINYHHLSVLCDRMTSNHNMVAIFRSGILNDNIGPISKSTFEVHTEVLLDASRHANLDCMRGVSASVMMGQTGNYGTGLFQVVLDTDALKNIDDVKFTENKGEEEINRMFSGLEDQNDSCSKNNITISNSLSNMKQVNVGQLDDDYDLGI